MTDKPDYHLIAGMICEKEEWNADIIECLAEHLLDADRRGYERCQKYICEFVSNLPDKKLMPKSWGCVECYMPSGEEIADAIRKMEPLRLRPTKFASSASRQTSSSTPEKETVS